MTTETYNGWANYPTWCVHLWLSNDEETHNSACEITRSAWLAATPSPSAWSAPRSAVADALREWVSDAYGERHDWDNPSLELDLLGWAFDNVDWFEIAQAYMETVRELAES